jgi:hypothetical protein
MSGTHLILHRVRGQPAFDIAERIQIGDEEGWIIPTSGHRAYPAKWWKLEYLFDGSDFPHTYPVEFADRLPKDWPDHYEPKPAEPLITNLLNALGLAPKIERRL